MQNEYKTSNKYYRNLVFWVGIIATLCYRIIIILNYYSTILVSIAWYIGTIGFIWYFAHRYRVENKYVRIIREEKLQEKLCAHKLEKDDCEALSYILRGLDSSKAKWNSIAIFVFSAIALIYAIFNDVVSLLK